MSPIRPENRARYPKDWREQVEGRILAHTEFSDECWVWTGSRNNRGYGRVNIFGRVQYAHRLIVMAGMGEEIPEGMQVDHLCRNRACVRPSHLEVVTPSENTRRGLASKLSTEQAKEIQRRRWAGEKVIALALEFGVHHGQISRIARTTGQSNFLEESEA